jgi:uncharacterized radical SAM superfamily Fe-S cluster-containing enzyme
MTTSVPVGIISKSLRAMEPDKHVVQAMPTSGPLVDSYGRVHNDLRISVTDRCNLRCVYCMPEEGMTFMERDQLLRFDEILRFAEVAKGLGVDAVRLTGGEPLVRKGLVSLVQGLSDLGFEDISLTTNGTELARHAEKLAQAGLRRVNHVDGRIRTEPDSLSSDRAAGAHDPRNRVGQSADQGGAR